MDHTHLMIHEAPSETVTKDADIFLESEYCFYLNTLKFCNVTKLLAYEIQTPFKWTKKKKHGSLHFSVSSVCNTRFISLSLSLSADSASLGPDPPPRTPLSFTLFTDYLTIQVLNKNEVRKWFEDYRSCRNMLNSNKFFLCVCEGASNKKGE